MPRQVVALFEGLPAALALEFLLAAFPAQSVGRGRRRRGGLGAIFGLRRRALVLRPHVVDQVARHAETRVALGAPVIVLRAGHARGERHDTGGDQRRLPGERQRGQLLVGGALVQRAELQREFVLVRILPYT